jgi:hypothetical protein
VLSTLEVEDIVTLRDVTSVLQRTEMVRRIAQEIDGYIIELGTDARLIQLQLDELLHDAEDDRSLVVHDYAGDSEESVQTALDSLSERATTSCSTCARQRHPPTRRRSRSRPPASARGYRLLTKVPRLSDQVVDDVVGRFGSLRKIMRATLGDLEDVEGVGRPEPGPSRKACPAWPRRAFSTATADAVERRHAHHGGVAGMSTSATYDVIVVGLGGMGSATVRQLADRGARVLGLERFTPGHDHGSSHGRSRIIRQAYFEDPAYVPLVLRSYDLWRQLEADGGEHLLTITGGLMIGRPDSELVQGARRSAELHGLDHEMLDAASWRAPSVVAPGRDEVALFEPPRRSSIQAR